ncbi:MAG: DUF1508 domain-containing protein [Desulfobacteraceae bacterium]|nr:DUF1508 domain-containing protein [Desulfobacteraceae bacterium]
MTKQFHIIIKITAANIFNSFFSIQLVLRDKNKKDIVNLHVILRRTKNFVFHVSHHSSTINHIDSLSFYLISQDQTDTLLLDCIEVVDLITKQLTYFPCGQWISDTYSENVASPFMLAQKVTNKRNCFEIIRGKNRQFYFRLRAGNCEIIAQSEGYKSKASAVKGIRAMKTLIPSAVVYDLTAPKPKNKTIQ